MALACASYAGSGVIAVDLLGYGDAPAPARTDAFKLDDEVDAIEQQLLRKLGTKRPLHLVGHSYGGAVAWRLALRDPSRVKSIALFEPVSLWLIHDRPEAEPLRALARSATRDMEMGLPMQAAQRFVDFWSGAGAFSALPTERRSAYAARMANVALDFVACVSERSPLPGRGQLRMPGLLLNGSATAEAMKTILRILRPSFADCTAAEVPGGHMAPVENRASVDSIIASFVRRSERSTTLPEPEFA